MERWVRLTVGIVLAAAVGYFAYRLRFVLVTVALAAMLTYAFLPLVEYAARLRIAGRAVPRVGATGLVFIVMTGGAMSISQLAASPVSDQGGEEPGGGP